MMIINFFMDDYDEFILMLWDIMLKKKCRFIISQSAINEVDLADLMDHGCNINFRKNVRYKPTKFPYIIINKEYEVEYVPNKVEVFLPPLNQQDLNIFNQ